MSHLKDFVTPVPALFPDQRVSEAADILLGNKDVQFLSMPVLDEGCPVGSISRYELQNIFMRRYGRELMGSKPISDLMNRKPIVIDADALNLLAKQPRAVEHAILTPHPGEAARLQGLRWARS